MRLFIFYKKNEKNINNNGWILSSKFKGNLGWFSLITPVMKEVTYSKGTTVRYKKHLVFGVGVINKKQEFKGITLFDPYVRIFISTVILSGVTYVAMNFYIGLIFSILFYMLISVLSLEDDDYLIQRCKLMYES